MMGLNIHGYTSDSLISWTHVQLLILYLKKGKEIFRNARPLPTMTTKVNKFERWGIISSSNSSSHKKWAIIMIIRMMHAVNSQMHLTPQSSYRGSGITQMTERRQSQDGITMNVVVTHNRCISYWVMSFVKDSPTMECTPFLSSTSCLCLRCLKMMPPRCTMHLICCVIFHLYLVQLLQTAVGEDTEQS